MGLCCNAAVVARPCTFLNISIGTMGAVDLPSYVLDSGCEHSVVSRTFVIHARDRGAIRKSRWNSPFCLRDNHGVMRYVVGSCVVVFYLGDEQTGEWHRYKEQCYIVQDGPTPMLSFRGPALSLGQGFLLRNNARVKRAGPKGTQFFSRRFSSRVREGWQLTLWTVKVMTAADFIMMTTTPPVASEWVEVTPLQSSEPRNQTQILLVPQPDALEPPVTRCVVEAKFTSIIRKLLSVPSPGALEVSAVYCSPCTSQEQLTVAFYFQITEARAAQLCRGAVAILQQRRISWSQAIRCSTWPRPLPAGHAVVHFLLHRKWPCIKHPVGGSRSYLEAEREQCEITKQQTLCESFTHWEPGGVFHGLLVLMESFCAAGMGELPFAVTADRFATSLTANRFATTQRVLDSLPRGQEPGALP